MVLQDSIDNLIGAVGDKVGIDRHNLIMKHIFDMENVTEGEVEIYVSNMIKETFELNAAEVRAIKKDIADKKKKAEKELRNRERIMRREEADKRKKAELKENDLRKLNQRIEKENRKNALDDDVHAKIDSLQKLAPIFFDEHRLSWLWDDMDTIYKRVDETDILLRAKDVFGYTIYDSKEKNEILELVRQSGRAMGIVPPDKTVIVFKGSAMDVLTGEITTPKPDKLYTSFIPHKIGESDETPTIDKLFKDWAGEKYMTLYEIFAYCMLDDYPHHRIFPLTGTGRNGKSEYMRLLKRFIGEDNVQSTDLDKLANSRFETSRLYKKKVALISETDPGIQIKTSTLKMLTGGDMIGCEFKGVDGFNFVNTAKVILSSNALPDTKDKTDGFYRRFIITPFENEFEENGSVIDVITEEEIENLVKKCINILKNVLENGFTHDGTVEEKRELYEQKANPIGTFITNYCTKNESEFVPLWYLKELFDEFTKKYAYGHISDADFKKSLIRDFGYDVQSKYMNIEQQKVYKLHGTNEGGSWQLVYGVKMKHITPM